MIDEIFVVQRHNKTQYYESRRSLARAVITGYVFEKKQDPLIVRFQRVPGKVANSDIGPDIKSYLEELPNYLRTNVEERAYLVDAMERHINTLLR